jgi:hypothetical protein
MLLDWMQNPNRAQLLISIIINKRDSESLHKRKKKEDTPASTKDVAKNTIRSSTWPAILNINIQFRRRMKSDIDKYAVSNNLFCQESFQAHHFST